MKLSKVYLVGAGPGDPGLITVRGIDCLKRADVVVYDHLLDEELLRNVPEYAERIYVGKKAAQHAMEQEEINALLVAKAQEGKIVVRLKGGDPFVLGRGAEEGEALLCQGVPFEVVPGVTSAVAVPSYAGIPVTHRGLASSFTVVTGHEAPAKKESSINWEYLAKGVDTLVILMGTQNLTEIVDRLVSSGRDSSTPVAVIANGTRPQQKTVTGTLKNISSEVERQGLKPPAIIVVGEVVRLRQTLNWFEKRPMFGKRVLVSRARHQASVMVKLLTERGAIPIELPAIRIVPADRDKLNDAVLRLPRYQWVLFTSANGVTAFFDCLSSLDMDARALYGMEIGAIGPATAEALGEKGIKADFVPCEFTSEGILMGLKDRRISGKTFLLPRADIADRTLVEGLARLGAKVEEVAAYHTEPAPESLMRACEDIKSGDIDVIAFASASTVTNLMKMFNGRSNLNGVVIACIGPKTAEKARQLGLKVDVIAKESTIPGLVDAVEDYFLKET